MISKEIQYRIYAGTSKDDYTGWTEAEVGPDAAGVEYWSLELGDGYYLDRATKVVKGLFKERKIRINSLRRDRSVEDPDGDYKDLNISMLFNVKIMVTPDDTLAISKSVACAAPLKSPFRQTASWMGKGYQRCSPDRPMPSTATWRTCSG